MKLPKTCLTLTAVLLAAACSKSSPTTPTPPCDRAAADRAGARDAERRSAVEHAPARAHRRRTARRTRRRARAPTNSRSPTTRVFAGRRLQRRASRRTPAGKTSFTPAQDLQPTTRMYWRARMVQGTTNSDWSTVGKFKTRLVGFNRPGELYDPLVNGETIGTIGGSATSRSMPGQGHPVERHPRLRGLRLPQVVPTGEILDGSQGLAPGRPGR